MKITYLEQGRGAWPYDGVGGTLSTDGSKPGSWYRAPKAGSSRPMPGLHAARAIRGNLPIGIDEFAVHMAVRFIQSVVRPQAVPDGIFGPATTVDLQRWQSASLLTADGVAGPKTLARMIEPYVRAAADTVTAKVDNLAGITLAHMSYESGFDPGAVGRTTPQDLGVAQINGAAHPYTEVERLTPAFACTWAVAFVQRNIEAMGGVVDDGIAAYNLGVGGARSWVSSGRPQMWRGTDVPKYIAHVKGRIPDDAALF